MSRFSEPQCRECGGGAGYNHSSGCESDPAKSEGIPKKIPSDISKPSDDIEKMCEQAKLASQAPAMARLLLECYEGSRGGNDELDGAEDLRDLLRAAGVLE